MVDSDINKGSNGLLFVPFAKISAYHEEYIKILMKPCLALNQKDAEHCNILKAKCILNCNFSDSIEARNFKYGLVYFIQNYFNVSFHL